MSSPGLPRPEPQSPSLAGILASELEEFLVSWNEPAFRSRQILHWLYAMRCTRFSAMTNLSEALRDRLRENFRLRSLTTARVQGSADATSKFLFRLDDGRFIESVLIPASEGAPGRRSPRRTLCVSSQIGCAYGCRFCASGLAGFARNLTAAEIVEQLLFAEQLSSRRVDNIVFMGMGEPLANYDAVLRSIRIFNAQWGPNVGARQITVSTSGLAPQIRTLAEEGLQIRLAVSLHGPTDEIREQIMPVNRRYPLAELQDALDFFRSQRKQRITFEYILIEGVNDEPAHARLLAALAHRTHAKVNLIPYNTVEGLSWRRPSLARQHSFAAILREHGCFATLRMEKGNDIDAACGQLRLREEISASLTA
ncbi:MAG TPA: 23S rRNA (adenine(2503)-C(2))-methyltransferase RlmN [Verrucomicrobiales bacterium]|nr:23S rRNA (adenine(2503)-C(2))-methyltransferase RlmN [Verrucomicrobiales bacterium]